MNPQDLSCCFKIDFIEAKQHAPPQSFPNGDYKPPVQPDHYTLRASTGWYHLTTNSVTQEFTPPPNMTQAYSTSVFYDGANTKRFLFHPADCRLVDISNIEREAAGDMWGWRKLCFTEKDANHSVLDHDGEYDSLCGGGGSYVPHLLPPCYKSEVNNNHCGLSGKMSLLLALTAFSCAQPNVIYAIKHRLNIRERRWDHVGNLGNGCKV
ncbi:hypothetical protein EPUS_07143 [Endocarpon pusillum Z07020]|uniref:Uncharacterized protein n=1 Tax=Endocarpon pusillum (strain Z07020 / HMAS-L-300199) TaxID=1263415 RepID=U1HF77_ENDPU|nr:uncharacterized protein EPUS_07143 [Endocarpon pusillum Z07020]ERF68725.1 hypothetical protein EPUS_07143 [Endocarpon pusillum Z07020]